MKEDRKRERIAKKKKGVKRAFKRKLICRHKVKHFILPTGSGTAMPKIGPGGRNPNFLPVITAVRPRAIESSAACCRFSATCNKPSNNGKYN